MEKLSMLFVVAILLVSCSKNKMTCTAKSAQGTELYTVVGEDVCQDQISQEDGEYCNCILRD
jgi:hypothetical protein